MKLEVSQNEVDGTRKALDEAINRLQATQEDVIDRMSMKHILLDWINMKSPKGRKEVLEVMSSLLHFNEEEKEKVGLFHYHSVTLAGKFVDAVAAPLPPTKLNIDKIEGDDLRSKFVHFLMAESSLDEDV